MSQKNSLVGALLNAFSVFLIFPIVTDIAIVPIAKILGVEIEIRKLILEFSLMLGAVAAILYVFVYLRWMFFGGGTFIVYSVIVLVLASMFLLAAYRAGDILEIWK